MQTRLLCLDVDGTVTNGIGGQIITGALEAVESLRQRLLLRFVTNATSRPHREIADALRDQGLLTSSEELVTPATTARRVLVPRSEAAGVLLVDERSREDFEWFEERDDGACVLLATEAHYLRISDLQPAVRALLHGASLYTLQSNRYFSQDGELVTDLGPVAAFLGYAATCQARNLGKPSPLVFDSLAKELGLTRSEIAMVGDDAEFDVAGPSKLGLVTMLVRTGKYRPGDEQRFGIPARDVIDSVRDLPDRIS